MLCLVSFSEDEMIDWRRDIDVMMKMASSAGTFSEQFSIVIDWFNTWNDCEKVVSLYYLLRKLPSPQTKFLSQVLDQIVASCSPIDLEEQANDPGLYHLMYQWKADVLIGCWDCTRSCLSRTSDVHVPCLCMLVLWQLVLSQLSLGNQNRDFFSKNRGRSKLWYFPCRNDFFYDF